MDNKWNCFCLSAENVDCEVRLSGLDLNSANYWPFSLYMPQFSYLPMERIIELLLDWTSYNIINALRMVQACSKSLLSIQWDHYFYPLDKSLLLTLWLSDASEEAFDEISGYGSALGISLWRALHCCCWLSGQESLPYHRFASKPCSVFVASGS